MFCTNCGNAIDDNAVVCVHCGAATQRGMTMGMGKPAEQPVDPNEPASGGLKLLSALVPLAGIILGATESSKGRKRASKSYFIAAVIGMIFYAVVGILLTVLICALPFLMMFLETKS